MIRTVWVAMNLLVATALLGSAVLVAALLRVRGRFYHWVSRTWARWALWASHTPVYVEGIEHVQPDEPQIVVANHQSWYDVFALAAVLKSSRFIAKKELAYIPLFGIAWKAAGHISIDRTNRESALRSLDRAGRQLREERSAVIIFAEGTRSPTGELLPFKKGAFMLALHTGVEIVPVAVTGTRRILPKGGWRIRPGPIIVRIGEPVQPPHARDPDRDRLMETVRERIQQMLAEPHTLRRAS